jgi:hypothetical protein
MAPSANDSRTRVSKPDTRCLDFVNDEQDIMRAAQCLHSLEIVGIGHDDTRQLEWSADGAPFSGSAF